MIKDDEIIDVNARETVLSGKMPRRLLWIIGTMFLLTLIAIGVYVVNGKESHRKDANDIKEGIAAKEAAPKSDESKTVTAIETEQTKKALEVVKGKPVVASEVQSELEKLKGSGTPSNSFVEKSTSTGSQDANQQAEIRKNAAIDAAQQAREKIATAPIFRSRSTLASSSSGQKNLSSEGELLKILASRGSNQTNIDPTVALKQALEAAGNSKNGNPSAAANELEFNAQMEQKKLNSPTGIIAKSKNDCLLTPGWLIPVANIEKMNSDVPGEVTLVVREDVYDSITNTCKAIPKGSKITVAYNPNIAVGQERFNIASTVMYFPNGKHVPMMGTNAYSSDGTAGIDADVNNHFVKMFGTALLLGFVDKMSSNDTVSTSSANGSSTSNTTVFGQTLGNTANAILQRNQNIRPTLTRDQATRFNLKVSREFYLEQYRD